MHAYIYCGGGREAIDGAAGTATVPHNFQNVDNRGESLAKFWSPGTGGVETCLIHPHPLNHLNFIFRHPLPRKDSIQGGGSHKGKGDVVTQERRIIVNPQQGKI